MLRRCLSASSHSARTANSAVGCQLPLTTGGCTFFGFGKGSGSDGGNSSGDDKKKSGLGGMPDIDMHRLRTMQQMFENMPPEKQEQMLKQAAQMQKMMSKIPGFNTYAQKNMALVEELMKKEGGGGAGGTNAGDSNSLFSGSSSPHTPPPPGPDPFASFPSMRKFAKQQQQQQQQQTSSSSSSASSSRSHPSSSGSSPRGTSSSASSGPTLDQLKKINLGPEIEALFAELRTMRATKNEYRDKYNAAEARAAQLQKELSETRATEEGLRGRLRKAEQETVLLNSDNMELRDKASRVTALTEENKKLQRELRELKEQQSAGTSPGSPAYAALQAELKASQNSLRTLQRRMGRHLKGNPCMAFSMSCNALTRHVERDAQDAEALDDAMYRLHTQWMEESQAAWTAASTADHAAAIAAASSLSFLFRHAVPHANYDAAVTVTDDTAAARRLFESAGFEVSVPAAEEPGRLIVSLPDTAEAPRGPGPFGYAWALRSAGGGDRPFTVTAVAPFISEALVRNERRSEVTYETARASGPGGQATNVTETQVYARLSIDGQHAFTAEAQDSRSAMQNKEAALERLRQQRRVQENKNLARAFKFEDSQKELVAKLADANGTDGDAPNRLLDKSVEALMKDAAAASAISPLDVVLLQCVQSLVPSPKSS